MKKTILAAGLNPAWQKTLLFEHFRPGAVNRAVSVQETPSGKGVNFIRAVRTWDLADATVFQFAGGVNGNRLTDALDNEGLSHRTVRIEPQTRCCTTVLCRTAHSMTELIEPSPSVPAQAVSDMFALFRDSLPGASALALCGTYPPGVPETFYTDLAREAALRGVFVFADAFLGMDLALRTGVDLLKINREELFALSGKKVLPDAFRECFRKYKVRILAVTDGANDAYLAENGEDPVQVPVPRVENPVNPIGSGDTCSGVMLSEILAGSSAFEAFRRGLAAASANCLTVLPATFDRDAAFAFLKKGF